MRQVAIKCLALMSKTGHHRLLCSREHLNGSSKCGSAVVTKFLKVNS